MSSARVRRARLDELMSAHNLTSQHVSELIDRNPAVVRRYRAGIQSIPPNMLRLLELELEHGRGLELIQSRAAG